MITMTAQGFQSIRNPITLEIQGLTTLEGESHLGKTACVRIIRAAFSNRTGTSFITVGEDQARFSWKTDKHHLIWEKKGSSTTYIIDGKRICKPGRGVIPPEVAAVGIREVITTDRRRYWPQIQTQGESHFILSENSVTTAAELLGANTEIVRVNRALKLSGLDLNRTKSLVSVLEEQHRQVSDKLLLLKSWYESLNQLFLESEKVRLEIESLQAQCDRFNKLKNQYDRLQKQLSLLGSGLALSWSEIPDTGPCERLFKLERCYRQLEQALSTKSINDNYIDDCLPERNRAREVQLLYRDLVFQVRQSLALKPVIQKVLPDRYDASADYRKIEDYRQLEYCYLRDSQALESLQRKQLAIQSKLDKLSHESITLHRDLNDIEECPLCSAPIRQGKYQSP